MIKPLPFASQLEAHLQEYGAERFPAKQCILQTSIFLMAFRARDSVLESKQQGVKTEADLISTFYITRITRFSRTLTLKNKIRFQGGRPILLYAIIKLEIVLST